MQAALEIEWTGELTHNLPHWEGEVLLVNGERVEVAPRVLEVVRSQPAELERFLREFGSPLGLREALLGAPAPRWLSTTDTQGHFEIELGEGEWTPQPTDPKSTFVARSTDADGVLLLVAPCVHLAGSVVDEDGRPVSMASLSYGIDLGQLDAFADTHRFQSAWNISGFSDENGHFEAQRVPAGSRFELEMQHSGFSTARLDPLEHDELALRVVLKRRAVEQGPQVSGLVLDPQGAPVEGAAVSLGQDQCWTDAQGRFEIHPSTSHLGESLTAVKKGLQPAILPGFGTRQMESRSEVLLRLGPPALSITGRVLLPDGSNPGKCNVQVADGTPYGSTQCYLEDVARGAHQPGMETDEQGRFALDGLAAREYRLLAWNSAHGQIVYSVPIAAGATDVVLQATSGDFLSSLEGRVITRHHVPVEGAEVRISTPTYVSSGSSSSMNFGSGATDADGRFVLKNVPLEWAHLSVGGRGLKLESHPVPARTEGNFELVATLEVRTRLELVDTSIDEVVFLDEQGERVHPMLVLRDCYSMRDSVPRLEQGFPAFEITDAAVTAVLMSGKAEVRRVPVEIRREKLLVLRF
ncbi:MAG: carboxypeptidase regulatory-like domain-containing protein [Planctomycetes bacterium]|nr:carboxypeptidase regulatory-like domain-containing protein [Planctomycetota bacterium]